MEKLMSRCDCLIGILNDYEQSETNSLYMSDYIQKLYDQANKSNRLKDIFKDRREIFPPDYLDRRKGYARLYNCCPYCGTKINFKKLKENLKNAKNS